MNEPKQASFYFACIMQAIITFIFTLPVILFPIGYLAVYFVMKYLNKSTKTQQYSKNYKPKVVVNFYTKYNTSYEFCEKTQKYDYNKPILKDSYNKNLKNAFKNIIINFTESSDSNNLQQTETYERIQTNLVITENSENANKPNKANKYDKVLSEALKNMIPTNSNYDDFYTQINDCDIREVKVVKTHHS